MDQIVLKGIGADVVASVRRVAERDDISENEAALKLLRKGAELEDDAPANGKIGHSLDHFMGTWSEEEAAEMQALLAENHVVHESDWR